MIEALVFKVLLEYMKENKYKTLLCFFDQAKCQFNEAFLMSLRNNNIHFVFILALMTGKVLHFLFSIFFYNFYFRLLFKAILQPADAYWNKPLRGDYIIDYNDWFVNGEKTLTSFGNLAGPGYFNMCNWIFKAWQKLDPEIIVQSFKGCGITSNKLKDYNKHLRAVLNGELKSSSTIVEKRSDYDIQEVSLFCDLDDYSSDDENDADYR